MRINIYKWRRKRVLASSGILHKVYEKIKDRGRERYVIGSIKLQIEGRKGVRIRVDRIHVFNELVREIVT